MYDAMVWRDYWAGIELLTQDYRAAIAALKTKPDLAQERWLRRRRELGEEYRSNCAQEFKVACAQMRDDHALMLKR